MLDYHLHLWPHSQSDAETTVEQVAAYCEQAAEAGVTEIAVTEHLFRFTQAKDLLGGFWDDLPGDALRPGMAAYWDHHARVDLDAYVEVVQAVKAEGLPGRARAGGRLLPGPDGRGGRAAGRLPLRRAARLGPLAGHLAVRRPERPAGHGRVGRPGHRRRCGTSTPGPWRSWGPPGSCDVFAHPDLVKIAGRVPAVPDEFYDRITEAAVRSGMAAELSSAGWRKPVGEEYPAPAAAQAVRRPGRPPHHRVGRPHPPRRGRPGRRPAGPAGRGRGRPGCRAIRGRRPYDGPGVADRPDRGA